MNATLKFLLLAAAATSLSNVTFAMQAGDTTESTPAASREAGLQALLLAATGAEPAHEAQIESLASSAEQAPHVCTGHCSHSRSHSPASTDSDSAPLLLLADDATTPAVVAAAATAAATAAGLTHWEEFVEWLKADAEWVKQNPELSTAITLGSAAAIVVLIVLYRQYQKSQRRSLKLRALRSAPVKLVQKVAAPVAQKALEIDTPAA
jgi:hypothetical protein